jgi:L-ascorbate metabolism protein UlaG (beta-lactamase superfamily)
MTARTGLFGAAVAALALAGAYGAAQAQPAQTVKITPLGSHDGEFCALDRAMIFEDPSGTRILYDAGRTVRGPDDPRLGNIDAVLLTHVHGDHLGDVIQPTANAGECGKPDFSVKVTPKSNTVNIVVAKKAQLLVGSEMAAFFAKKIAGAGGNASQAVVVRFGAARKVGGVTVTTVPAVHSNGLAGDFLDGDLARQVADNGLTISLGPATGYVLTFSNGLVAYLSGDTGITAEQKVVVHDYYKAKLAVINIGDVFTTGPKEAAWVMNDLVEPVSVIPSHANEAATKGGKVLPGTRTATFIRATRAPVYVPLSGKTLEFDGAGKCVKGCK